VLRAAFPLAGGASDARGSGEAGSFRPGRELWGGAGLVSLIQGLGCCWYFTRPQFLPVHN
jgi:hypothetical protein